VTALDLYASAQNYADHLTPIADALENRGVAVCRYKARSFQTWASARPPRPIALRGVQAAMVASYVDFLATAPAPVVYVEHGAGQSYDGDPISAAHESYSGGRGFERVVLFVCPSERVADRWRQAYPETPAVAVGCPKLDRWHDEMRDVELFHRYSRESTRPASYSSGYDESSGPGVAGAVGPEHEGAATASTVRPNTCATGESLTRSPLSSDDETRHGHTPGCTCDEASSPDSPAQSAVTSAQKCTMTTTTDRSTSPGSAAHAISTPIVAVTFHWDCPLVPETLSALRHYDRHLPLLVQWARSEGVDLLGHAHPRMWGRLSERWRHLGVAPTREFGTVLDQADVLVFDNTSAGFEFASCDRPVVVLNAPWYRRDVDHGGRFWRWADVGVQVDEGRDLIAAIEQALDEPSDVAENRRRIVGEVYAHTDGRAAERAADAIAKVLDDGDTIRQAGRATPRGF
jgi:hypothetical protein